MALDSAARAAALQIVAKKPVGLKNGIHRGFQAFRLLHRSYGLFIIDDTASDRPKAAAK